MTRAAAAPRLASPSGSPTVIARLPRSDACRRCETVCRLAADRRRRPLHCRARSGLHARDAGGHRRAGRLHGDRSCREPAVRDGGAVQRHGGAWRRFRRHVTKAARCTPAPSSCRPLLATAEQHRLSRRRRRARHRGRLRSHVPPVSRGAQARAPGGLPSDGGVRRDRRRGGCRCGACACDAAQLVDAMGIAGQHGVGHHRIPGRRRVDQAHASGLGGAGGLSRRAPGARRASSARARCSKASMASSTRSRVTHGGDFARHARRLRHARGCAPTSRSSRTPAARWRIRTSTARASSWPPASTRRRRRAIECETAEGIVHRLWEPLAAKQNPPNGYAAKFSIPYAIAVGMLRDERGGLREYGGSQSCHDPRCACARCAAKGLGATASCGS